MTAPLIVRPVRQSDFDAMMVLAKETGPGFTSLPEDEGLMQRKIDSSLLSFSGGYDTPRKGRYLLVAECSETGEIAGCSAVKAAVGVDQPFYNYRLITLMQSSSVVDRQFEMEALILTNEFGGCTEVGSLFLREKFRGGGNGKLLARSRYMLIASQPESFGETVIAELRGTIDSDSYSPFWEALSGRFFKMDYDEADRLSAVTDNQFIMDLMPKLPIYVDLLAPEAQAAIGKCHPEGVGAVKMLEWEGLRYSKAVDIFDGGPMMTGPRDQLRTVREAKVLQVKLGQVSDDAQATKCLIARPGLGNFKAMHAKAVVEADAITVDPFVLEALDVSAGESLRVWAPL